jgi:hypothetical protein
MLLDPMQLSLVQEWSWKSLSNLLGDVHLFGATNPDVDKNADPHCGGNGPATSHRVGFRSFIKDPVFGHVDHLTEQAIRRPC